MSDTICAISTANGNGAIALVRLSGNKAIHIVDNIFKPIKRSLSFANDVQPNKVYFGTIYDKKELIDEVLLSFFKGPNSFTGEDVVDFTDSLTLDLCDSNY